MKRVLFRLSMPSVNSWNGRWSGEEKNYVLVKSVPDVRAAELGLPKSWTYSFGDGWVARVSGCEMGPGERKPKSDGFCGYDWMVANILRWGTASCQCEWVPDPKWQEGEEWDRCIHCSTRRQVVAP